MSDVSAFKFGENIAVSSGKVIFQNDLMQLISLPAGRRRTSKSVRFFVEVDGARSIGSCYG
jgi:poly(3-hydroxyalkanoate) synthetase